MKQKGGHAKSSGKDDGGNKEEEKQIVEVAKHLRHTVAVKKAQIKGEKVEYFSGSKAVDCLMESKWTKEPKPEARYYTPHFKARADAILFCSTLLKRGYFVGAKKVEVKSRSEEESTSGSGKQKGEKSSTDSPKAGKDGKKSAKKRFRLDWNPIRTFADSPEELYVWRYDAPSRSSYFLGLGVVLVVIAVTLQPLWPSSSQMGVYYLSMGLLFLFSLLLCVYIVRWFLWGLVLTFSGGKIDLWLLPNLDNEKLGILDSFKPLYSLERKKEKKSKKQKQPAAEETETSDVTASEE